MTKRLWHLPPAPQRVKAAFDASASESRNEAPPQTNVAQRTSFSSDGTLTPDSQQSEIIRMADAMNALTRGCLRRITEDADSVVEPILQCVQIKPMNSQQGAERYRVVMNDSVNFMQGMLGQQLNHVIHENKLRKGCICRLKSFQSNFVKDKFILIILDFDILDEYGEPEKLGQPIALDSVKSDEQGQQGFKQEQPGNIAGNGFYGSKPQAQPQQQQQALPSRTNGATNHKGGPQGNIYPIEALSPYAHKWTIKARCTSKGEIKHWHNTKGEGKLFSANFLDESGEIRATGFNDAVDTWYDTLEEGSVYYITSPCKVQLAKKQFSNLNNDYELTFEKDTLIEKAEDTDGVPQVTYNFTSISDLQSVEKDATIDAIGVLTDIGEVSEITSKSSGKPFSKRELTLVDNTGYNVRLTIWGKTAQSFEGQTESVIAFKGLKVSDFGGRSLSLLSSGSMNVNPDIEEAYKLKGWYDGSGRNETFQSHQNTMSTINATTGGDRNAYKTIAQVQDENLGMGEDTDWFSLKATIIFVKSENFAYPACRSEGCNKKVLPSGMDEETWRCEKCEKEWDAPDYRYIMTINVSDHTGQMWLNCFNETGVQIMGMNANDLMKMKDEGDDRAVKEAFSEANCQTFVFRCKAKMDTYQDQMRVRYQVQNARALDFSVESKKLADMISKYSLQENSLFVN